MKICKKCGKIVSHNSYFKGYYCDQCGNFEGEEDNCTYSTTGCGSCNYTRLLSELDKYKRLGYSPEEIKVRLEMAEKYEELCR